VARIGEALATILPGPPRAGVAGTSFAATVAAAHASEGGPPILVPPGDDDRFLAPYPARLLTRDPDIRARHRPVRAAHHRGRWRSCRARQWWPVRGRGRAAPCTGQARRRSGSGRRRTPERMALALPLEPPGRGARAVRSCFRRLAATLADQLGPGAGGGDRPPRRHLRPGLRPPGTPPETRIEQRLPEPTADAERSSACCIARLEKAPPPAASRAWSWSSRWSRRRRVSSCRCSPAPQAAGTHASSGS